MLGYNVPLSQAGNAPSWTSLLSSPSGRADEICYPLSDHDGRKIRVGARDLWHDGRIGHPQAADAVDATSRVDHCCLVVFAAPGAGATRVEHGPRRGKDFICGQRLAPILVYDQPARADHAF